jgi:peptidylprolyl isomerase/peptidyl-prolyl cis-trans isomerase B (cyclophilin B)
MVLLIPLLLVACDGGNQDIRHQKGSSAVSKAPSKAPLATDPDIPEGRHVRVDTDEGQFLIELLPEVAPNTVANFKVLVANGFYDGLTFHRVISDFVAQGGDPLGNGMGGPGYTIKAEFNDAKHLRGTVAMARSSDPNSAGSQFYICLSPQPQLDGKYTVFGRVIEGMDVVDRIRVGTVMRKLTLLP